MLSPFARALAYYLAGGFGLVLLCTALFLHATPEIDARACRRSRRHALALALVGVAHPVVAGTAFVLARDVARADASDTGRTTTVASVSLALSLLVAGGVLIGVE